jgi:hypothetical protein
MKECLNAVVCVLTVAVRLTVLICLQNRLSMNLEDVSNSVEFLQINQLSEELFDEEYLQKQSMDTLFIIRKTIQLTGRMFYY